MGTETPLDPGWVQSVELVHGVTRGQGVAGDQVHIGATASKYKMAARLRFAV